MSLPKIRQIQCTECGKVFDVTTYDSINVSLDPELKKKIISGEIFSFVCPYCGHEHYISYPFLYHDMEHHFMIQQGTIGELMNYFCESADSKINKDFPGLLGNYTNIGVTSYSNLLSKIAILEKGLNWKVITLYQTIFGHQLSQFLDKDKKEKIVDMFFIIGEEDKLTLLVNLESLDDKHNRRFVPFDFEQERYDELLKEHQDTLKDVYSYVFDNQAAIKYLVTDPKEIEDLKATVMEIALVLTSDNEWIVTFVPEFNEGKYKEEDVVIIMKDMSIAKGRIKRILHMNRFELPLDLDDMPVVAWSVTSMPLTTTGNADDELDNSELKKMFEGYKKDGKLNEELMMRSNVIVPLVGIAQLSEEDISKLSIGDAISGDKVKLEFKTYDENGHPLFCVYLEQGDIKSENTSKAIYNFNNIIDLVLNSPNRYDGLIVNPDTDKIILTNKRLVKYKQDRTMTHAGRMRKVLSSLTEQEISYLGKDRYEIICKVYFEEMKPKQIAEALGKTEDELKDAFGRGYWLLKHIVWDNY